jgi:hypothetical protein
MEFFSEMQMPADSRFCENDAVPGNIKKRRGTPLSNFKECRAAILSPGVCRHSHERGNPFASRAAILSPGVCRHSHERGNLPASLHR